LPLVTASLILGLIPLNQSLEQPETPGIPAVSFDNGPEAIPCASACGVGLDPGMG